jgi:hypothetical protein
MKLRALLVGLILTCAVFGQSNLTTPPNHRLSSSMGMYDAGAYNYQVSVYSGQATGGTYTISLYTPSITLPDGRTAYPFGFTAVATENVAIPPITIGSGGNQETVTPTSTSGCNAGNTGASQQGLCTITAVFANGHGRGDYVTSGDNGWQEAMNDAAANGGGEVHWIVDCGIITLSTSGATTTTTCLMPKDFTNIGGSVHVTTTVTTAASYSIGISGATASFISSCTSLTAGLGCAGFQVSPTTVNGGAGMGDLLVTANATAGAGALRVKIWGWSMAQSNF